MSPKPFEAGEGEGEANSIAIGAGLANLHLVVKVRPIRRSPHKDMGVPGSRGQLKRGAY